jgi:hypothetical protein
MEVADLQHDSKMLHWHTTSLPKASDTSMKATPARHELDLHEYGEFSSQAARAQDALNRLVPFARR